MYLVIAPEIVLAYLGGYPPLASLKRETLVASGGVAEH